jgi:hypothetical protein
MKGKAAHEAGLPYERLFRDKNGCLHLAWQGGILC